jgi:hypothetical protein
MGKLYQRLEPELIRWIEAQHLFFVATAPREGGHINCSPKGLDALRVLGDRSVAYLDLTGSGAETIAHLRDDGRILLMFCAFEGAPKIVRLHGRGAVTQAGDPRFVEALTSFLPLSPAMRASARAVITVEIDRISDSCGHGVPLMEFQADRTQTVDWTENRLRKVGPDAMVRYQAEKNLTSIDGLPALDPALQGIPAEQ